MRRTVITCHRPKPGRAEALSVVVGSHHARLYEQGSVTRRPPLLMRARDGTLVEALEWKSERALEEARANPAVQALSQRFAEVCDAVPLAVLAEAGMPFSSFESADLAVVRPPFSRIFNHVQVDARISTSGAITAEAIAEMAAHGYRTVINLLPDDNRSALAGEAGLMAQHGFAYHHIPVDFAAPTEHDYRSLVAAMDELAPETKVFVHCAANMRVSAFMSLYGRERLGWSAARADEHVAEVWQPDEVWSRFLTARSG